MATDVITGLGGRADYVARSPQVDAGRLSLSDEEGLVFSLVGRASQIKDVLSRSGLPEPKAIAVLLQLRAKGAIMPARMGGVAASEPPRVVDMGMAEEVDLADDRKAEILAMEQTMDSKNPFELLGVTPAATAPEARAAFYALSRKFHPDRYFGKSLGSFRGRIERLFLKLSQANEIVGDEQKRAAYLKAHPYLLAQIAAAEAAAKAAAKTAEAERVSKQAGSNQPASRPAVPPRPPPPSKPAPIDPVREAERRARLARHPYLAKNQKVNDLIARAKEQIDKGNYGHAYTDLNMATQLDPRNDEIKQLLAESKRKNDLDRSEAEYKRGLQLVEQENPHAALNSFRAAVSVNPHHSRAAYEAAKLLWHVDNNVKEASSYAQKAVDADQTHVASLVLLAQLMDEAGHKALAKKYAEEALKHDPKNAEAKKAVKGRWPF